MADDRHPVRRALAEHLPVEKASRLKVTRRGVALVIGVIVLLAGSKLGLGDILATLLAILVGVLWLKFGPAARQTGSDASE